MVATEPLPVESALPELRRALADHPSRAAVLQAPPGAGKTTVVPLRLLDEPWLEGRRIVVLEPRRLATRAAARRMAWMLGQDVGATVGYRTRDEQRVGRGTRIEVVTEGILTRRIQHDAALDGTGLVVFDEFHERSLPADLGLALTLDIRRSLRPDLRLLVMSATLDGERVAAHLGGAPVVTSEGRMFPVDVRWAPKPPAKGRRGAAPRPAEAVSDTVRRALREEADGDVLAFLPGAADIRRSVDLLTAALPPAVDVRPLFGALSAAEQDAALVPSPAGRRKVVLATDIAETSLTVEGVRVVVDAGLARVPRFDPRTGMTRLRTVPASRASADQRAGRAGRTAPGVAYRLWSRLEHAARRPSIDAEITQVDLAGLALELAAWGTPDPAALPFLDPPPGAAFEEGRSLLVLLGALDGDGRRTDLGRAMVDLPLHPRLARMVAVAGPVDRWLACLLAALLEDRDVLRGRPDELPVDVGERLALLADPGRRHPLADGRAVRSARERAFDLAGRLGGDGGGEVAPERAGALLAVAYPDRLGQSRSGGRFRLRTGAGAWVPKDSFLAIEPLIVAAEVDGDRRDTRIRLAAPVTEDEAVAAAGGAVEESVELVWDTGRDELVERAERRIGALVLDTVERRASPGPATIAALVDRVRVAGLGLLGWTADARRLQQRIGFLRAHLGDTWPDVSDAGLVADVDDWLPAFLPGATGRSDLASLDVAAVLRTRLTADQRRDLDRLAPATYQLPGGRRATLDYGADPPVLAARVQQLFGVTETPTVAGGLVSVVVHLLSPADRPVQVTSDLAGFWTGSWHEVRKELAGRYPKHAWPEDPRPTSAQGG